MKARLGPDDHNTLWAWITRLWLLRGREVDLAVPLFEETFKLSKAKLGPDHPNTLVSMAHLALPYLQAGKLDLALPLYEERSSSRKRSSVPLIPTR